MWIAQEGCDAPLPAGWGEAVTADGTTYYFEKETRRSIWEHPYDEHYRKLVVKSRKELGNATQMAGGGGGGGGSFGAE